MGIEWGRCIYISGSLCMCVSEDSAMLCDLLTGFKRQASSIVCKTRAQQGHGGGLASETRWLCDSGQVVIPICSAVYCRGPSDFCVVTGLCDGATAMSHANAASQHHMRRVRRTIPPYPPGSYRVARWRRRNQNEAIGYRTCARHRAALS